MQYEFQMMENYIIHALTFLTIQSGPEKIVQSLIHCHYAVVCSRITRFSPKCSEINW